MAGDYGTQGQLFFFFKPKLLMYLPNPHTVLT